jgi:LacI family transcriptional regulator
VKNNRRVTLREVAQEVGLSVTQTSRALNDHWDVAEKTKSDARAAAEKLGYVPNLEARRLKTGSTRAGAIGLMLPQAELRFTDSFFAALLSGIMEEAAHAGLELRLNANLGGSDDLEPYRRAIAAHQVDGFVLVRIETDDARVANLTEAGFPFVAFGRVSGTCSFPFVDDADHVMQPVVDHLVDLGHRRIACLAEPAGYAMADRRMRSFTAALRARGIEPDDKLRASADFHEDTGYRRTRELLDLAEPPTAIVAFNDLLALGALGAARDVGVDVPGQLSITGFDDVPVAQYSSPGLTTLRRSGWDIGRQLCQQLTDEIERTTKVERQILLEPELIVRGSTAVPGS